MAAGGLLDHLATGGDALFFRKLSELGESTGDAALDDADVAEAPYLLGVLHLRNGDYQAALASMERSLALNPGHIQGQEQVQNLRELIASDG